MNNKFIQCHLKSDRSLPLYIATERINAVYEYNDNTYVSIGAARDGDELVVAESAKEVMDKIQEAYNENT